MIRAGQKAPDFVAPAYHNQAGFSTITKKARA
jgi:hypothetical protein